MTLVFRIITSAIVALSLTPPLPAAESTLDENLLLKGEVILEKIKVKDEVWPRLEGHAIMAGNPLDCVSVYYALRDQSKYIPNMKVSEPIAQLSPTVVHTRYILNMPWPLSDTEYINGSSVEKEGDDYVVKWWKIKNPTAEIVKGSARFSPSKKQGHCRLTYQSFVRPDSMLAGIVKNLMIRDVKASLEAIRDYNLKVRNDVKLLESYRQLILKAISGQYAYDPAPHISKE